MTYDTGLIAFTTGVVTVAIIMLVTFLYPTIKRMIKPLLNPMLTITRGSSSWADHFVSRTVFDQFADHAQREEESSRIEREIRENNTPLTRYGTPDYNYAIQARTAPLASQLEAIRGSFTVTTTGRAGEVLQELNHRRRPTNIPPITQENCMHYFQEFQMVNRAPLRICEICGYEEGGPPKTEGGIPNCKHEWGPIKAYKNGRQEKVFGRACHVCGRMKEEQAVKKSIAELRKSKTRSIILEKE